MSIFGPASPETQVAPILKAQEDHLNNKIPPVLDDQKPKESPFKLFKSYLDTGNTMFQQASHDALNKLSMFANKAETFASQFPDNLIGNVVTYDRAQAQTIEPAHIQKLAFSENDVPTAHLADGSIQPINAVQLNVQPAPLQSLTYKIPAGKEAGKILSDTVTIDDPSKLKVAGTVKAVADQINPNYTNYLLKLANNEGTLNPKARLYNFKDGTSSNNAADAVHHGGIDSVDRGIFQINDKAFPKITDEMADNPEIATLWAISLIDAGKQNKWVANQKTKDTHVSYQ